MEKEQKQTQQELLNQRKRVIKGIGEEWKYLADVDLEHTISWLQKEWKGTAATAFLQKGMELKDAMKKTGEYLLEV